MTAEKKAALQAAKREHLQKLSADALVADARATAANNKTTSQRNKDRRLNLQFREDGDAAVRLIDGADAAPPNATRARELEKLTKVIPATDAAQLILESRVALREKEAAERLVPYTAAMLGVVTAIQDPAVDTIRSGLSGLADALADLIAADLVRARTIGATFQVAAGSQAPASGSVMARKLINGLPKRLRPDGLNWENLERAARKIATRTLAEIQETEA